MLDRADYTDFGCHNSIRLEAEHFLNTLALTVISFSGRFAFASDPLAVTLGFRSFQGKVFILCLPTLVWVFIGLIACMGLLLLKIALKLTE